MLPDIHEAARGRWRGILSHYGLSQKELSGKHTACPMCGGVDRFRFDDKGGRGTFFCNNCGAGSGMDLVMHLKGWDFKTAVQDVRPLVGISTAEPVKPGMSEDKQREMRRAIWNASRAITKGDEVDRYLAGRGVALDDYPASLRFNPALRYVEGRSFPGMVAAVQDEDGQGVTLHRTFLQGGEKAPIDTPRRLTPGPIPNGSAVRLTAPAAVMGIAEGIETAIAASKRFTVPTWAALNANLLAEWVPPVGVREVLVFGDNDPAFAGQAAAYLLARNLSRKKIKARVLIPHEVGTDWADDISRRDH